MNRGVWDIMNFWHENAGMLFMVWGSFVLNVAPGKFSNVLLFLQSDDEVRCRVDECNLSLI